MTRTYDDPQPDDPRPPITRRMAMEALRGQVWVDIDGTMVPLHEALAGPPPEVVEPSDGEAAAPAEPDTVLRPRREVLGEHLANATRRLQTASTDCVIVAHRHQLRDVIARIEQVARGEGVDDLVPDGTPPIDLAHMLSTLCAEWGHSGTLTRLLGRLDTDQAADLLVEYLAEAPYAIASDVRDRLQGMFPPSRPDLADPAPKGTVDRPLTPAEAAMAMALVAVQRVDGGRSPASMIHRAGLVVRMATGPGNSDQPWLDEDLVTAYDEVTER